MAELTQEQASVLETAKRLAKEKEELAKIATKEQDQEYEEYKLEEYCWSIIEIALSFRVMDLAEQWGHPPKWRKS